MRNTKANLTNEQEKVYLDDPSRCPVCKSDSIESQSFEYGHKQIWRNVICLRSRCEAVWREVFTLTEIEDVD